MGYFIIARTRILHLLGLYPIVPINWYDKLVKPVLVEPTEDLSSNEGQEIAPTLTHPYLATPAFYSELTLTQEIFTLSRIQ